MKVASTTMAFLACALLVSGLVVYEGADAAGRTAFAAPNSAILAINNGNGPPPPLKSGCTSLVLDSSHSTIPQFGGSPASMAYGCGVGGASPAIVTSHSHSSKKLTATPVFSNPLGWSLGLREATGLGGCSSGVIPLISETPVTLSPSTNYSYCLTTTDASTFSPFSVTWTQ